MVLSTEQGSETESMTSTGLLKSMNFRRSMKSTRSTRSMRGSTVDTVNESMKSTRSIRSTEFAGSIGWKTTSQRGQRGLWSLRVNGVNAVYEVYEVHEVDIQCFHFTHELCHCLYFQQKNSWNIRTLNYFRKIYKINPEFSEIFWY